MRTLTTPISAKDKLIRSNLDRCFLTKGRDITGRDAWYFVLIRPFRLRAFLTHKTGDSYNLEDYGDIILSGYGEEVPEEVRALLREKYSFDNF